MPKSFFTVLNDKIKSIFCFLNFLKAENKRHKCLETTRKASAHKPVFIIEQKYKMFDKSTLKPIDQRDSSYLMSNLNGAESQYYCSIGTNKTYGRNLVESHLKACLYSGIKMKSYLNETVNQWTFEIGPCDALECADHLWMARYLLHRISEDFDIVIKYDTNTILNSNTNISDNKRTSLANTNVYFSTNNNQTEYVFRKCLIKLKVLF